MRVRSHACLRAYIREYLLVCLISGIFVLLCVCLLVVPSYMLACLLALVRTQLCVHMHVFVCGFTYILAYMLICLHDR